MAYADQRQGEVHQRRPLRKRRKPCTKQWTHDPILLDWSGALIPMNQRHLSNRCLVMRPRAPVMLQLLLNLQLAWHLGRWMNGLKKKKRKMATREVIEELEMKNLKLENEKLSQEINPLCKWPTTFENWSDMVTNPNPATSADGGLWYIQTITNEFVIGACRKEAKTNKQLQHRGIDCFSRHSLPFDENVGPRWDIEAKEKKTTSSTI